MKDFLKKAALLILVLLYTSVTFSQRNKIEKADKNFKTYSYIDAREIYLKVVENGYESAQIYKKLGDTYYYNSEYESASIWYTKLINTYPEETEAEYYFKAAQSLKSANKYEESDELMEAYALKEGGEGITVSHFENSTDYLKSIAEHAKHYLLDKVAINSEASDFGASFYGDKIVFASNPDDTEGNKVMAWNGQPYLDLYEANMDSLGNLSNVSILKGDINTKYNESSTTFTKDGETVYFTRNNFFEGKKGRDKDKTIKLKLYKATKSSDSIWGNIVELPFSSDEYSVAHPALSVDEKRLYFASDMTGTFGKSDIWYVDILEDNTYGVPVNLGTKINTEARESFPFISNKNRLYFSSDDHTGLGGLDVFVISLDDQGSIKGDIRNLGEPANSNYDDFGFIIDEEKQFGYVSSNREGDGGGSVNDDIYFVKEICEITISGLVTDSITGKLLPGALVSLLDEDNKLVESETVGADAFYSFIADCDTKYTIRGTKEEYVPKEKVVETPEETGSIDVPLALFNPCPPEDLGCRLSLEPIYFDFDRFNIRPDAAIELSKILAAMEEYPQLNIHIESHTDSRATHAYNDILSEKRAQSTLNWLVDQGIDSSRLSAKGYGENQLVNDCSDGVQCTEEEHQLNRRSMFVIQN
jgi:outer membrane protein OmpA-like peptidoglycan-associated protein/tetratricopeptide (TPR) repeat protein